MDSVVAPPRRRTRTQPLVRRITVVLVPPVDEFDLVVGAGGNVTVTPNVDYWLPIIPSFGIQYEF